MLNIQKKGMYFLMMITIVATTIEGSSWSMKREESSSNKYNTYNKAIDQQNIEEPKQKTKSWFFGATRRTATDTTTSTNSCSIKGGYSISEETNINEPKTEHRVLTRTRQSK